MNKYSISNKSMILQIYDMGRKHSCLFLDFQVHDYITTILQYVWKTVHLMKNLQRLM